jgi:DNA-binding MarR family transcriptional regulator
MAASNTFLGMIMAWELAVPAELIDEEPRILIRLLSIGTVWAKQRELMLELGIKQSRMSKLLSKLTELGLIEQEELPDDRRWSQYRSTPAAAQLLENLEGAMATFFSA